MNRLTHHRGKLAFTAVALAALAAACNDDDEDMARLSPAVSGALQTCTALASSATFTMPNTRVLSASSVAANTLVVNGIPFVAHCLVRGVMHERTGTDNGSYGINFEMRLPLAWSGRFFYQADGGSDGAVRPAVGGMLGNGRTVTTALNQGFAVISTDAGHSEVTNALFGFENQARLDYGYQAVQKLTPMTKGLIRAAYGRGPDRSYFGGCSNGGRHTLVATTRLPDEYDGYLAGAPGYNLPRAAVAKLWTIQQYRTIATPGSTTIGPPWLGSPVLDPDLSTGFTDAERAMVAGRIINRCDALDGAADGIVADTQACQAAFDLQRDVPTCTGARDGSCLSPAQKTVIASGFTGARTSTGTAIYSSFPYDPGIGSFDWSVWQWMLGTVLVPFSVGTIFTTPPAFIDWRTAGVDAAYAGITASNSTYTMSSMAFMTPPNPSDLSRIKARGAKVMIYHGVSDNIFSYNDSIKWMTDANAANGGDATGYARLYGVPGMAHCDGGPATDSFDMLTELVKWVEQGQAPDQVIATARGGTTSSDRNPEVPATWAANRTRPLCPYPKVARYSGSGSLESASSFVCR